MLICSKCKNTIDRSDAVLGGYICKVCGKFNPKKEATIQCLDKPAKRQIQFKETMKKISRKFEMFKKIVDYYIK
jgi:hypothetical protein